MREIKFKVWDNDSYMSSSFTLNDLVLNHIKFTPECTVIEYTGLKDKNGIEIYEGYVLKVYLSFSSYEFIPPYIPTGHDGYGSIACEGRVVSRDECFMFHCEKVLKETSPWHDDYNLTKHFMGRYFNIGINSIYTQEIIGNVYENPELLNNNKL